MVDPRPVSASPESPLFPALASRPLDGRLAHATALARGVIVIVLGRTLTPATVVRRRWFAKWGIGMVAGLVGLAVVGSLSQASAQEAIVEALRAATGAPIEPSMAAADDRRPPMPDDWAADYLQDPLAGVDDPTVSQLRAALTDPERRLGVLPNHYPRARSLKDDERLAFLNDALGNESFVVRQQAARELQRLGLLAGIVTEKLRDLALDTDATSRAVGVLGLSRLQASGLPRDEAYVNTLLEVLAAEDEELRSAASKQLVGLGVDAVPALLTALNDPEVARAAAELLGHISSTAPWETATGEEIAFESMPAEVGLGAAAPRTPAFVPPAMAPTPVPDAGLPAPERTPGRPPWLRSLPPPRTVEAPPPKRAPSQPGMAESFEAPLVRELDDQQPQRVRVYYGTNREILEDPTRLGPLAIVIHLTVSGLAIVLPLAFLFTRHERVDSGPGTGNAPHRFRAVVWTAGLLAAAYFWSVPALSEEVRRRNSERQGVVYGPTRHRGGVKHYGYCDVSIPPTHQVGEVETPQFGLEDESRHVILRSVEVLEREAYFEELRRVMSQFADSHACFVFIHGYNVDFDSAAKRTAQIHYDLKFQGVPIFYSWPSRASLRHYFSDRNEVQFSRQLIKEFLLDVVEKSGADRVHVIAHSMGADAVAGAIASMDSDREVFDQIILAAPDIDADVFLDQVAPRLSRLSKRTTLYCSRNDWALRSSYYFNDSWRAGDSSRGLLVAPDFDTIDASSIDTELLGHSYYGNCVDILNDVAELFLHNPEPADRHLVNVPWSTLAPAWTFPRLLEPRSAAPAVLPP